MTALTASQTVGPFFSPALLRPDAERHVLVQPDTTGQRIRIEGRVLDADRQPIDDALVEIWQANAHGRYNHPLDQRPLPSEPSFIGFGRSGTEDAGRFWFETVKPGRVPDDQGRLQAPHIVVTVFARGLLNHAVTRLYFADDPSTEQDPILQRVPPERRSTLLAQPTGIEGAVKGYQFDIRLQGAGETAFFNV